MPELQPRIPPDVQEQLIALADAGENVWQQVAVIALQLCEQPGAQKMRIYQDMAALLGMKKSGIRNWVNTYAAVGDDVLTEFPQFRISHWRVLMAAAHRQNVPVVQLAMQWAATEDSYGGRPIPPDALAAKLGKPVDERLPLVKALERAGSAVASAQRECIERDMLDNLDRIGATLQLLAGQAAEAARVTKENGDNGRA